MRMKMGAARIIILFLFFQTLSHGQPGRTNWSAQQNTSKVFIENKGQFVLPENIVSKKILCQADFGPQLYFTSTGIIYCLTKSEKMARKEKKSFVGPGKEESEREQGDEHERKVLKNFYVNMEWVGANPNVELLVSDKVKEYWNYMDPANPKRSIDRALGYKKLVYKNLYPNIDVEYVFHDKEGVKYNLILHPGADISKVKMKYTGAKDIFKDNSGNISFSTEAGTVTDHAPSTFYESGREEITSAFHLENNVVTFDLGTYDHTRTVVVDPWINSTLVPMYTTVELSVDASNNVYVYGFVGNQASGNSTLAIYEQKYNAAGALQWTFTFTQAMRYDQNTGDIVVDPAGNSYVTNGFFMIGYFIADCMQSKLDPAGTLIWNLQSPNLYENWRNAMNCDYTQLVQIGVGPGCCDWGKGTIINTTTGVESGMFSPPATGDIISASYGKNGYLYILSVKDDYAVNPPPNGPHLACLDPATGFSVVFNNLYPVSPAFVDGFKTNYGTNGMNGIVAGCSYLYVCLGATLEKRDLNTGALISSVAVPGGVQHSNAGTAVDKCGNVYVGSSNGVRVFDPNLAPLATFATPAPVFDIVIGTGGLFYACGGTATSTVNTGFVAQFSMASVCNPITVTTTPNACGSTNIGTATATPLFCAGPYTYAWSTTPVQTTQTATGLAGGTYSVIVTGSGACNEIDTALAIIPSGLLVVTVPPYVNVSCNGGNNGSASISTSGGTSPFTYAWNPTGQTTSTATGLSAGIYSVTVTDAAGCSGTQTVSITQPTTLTGTVSSAPAACGGNNGSAMVSVSGGTISYTYSWNPSGQTTQSASNLSAGTYSVTVTDANGCTVSNTVTVASTGSITATAGPNSTVCSGQTVSLSASGGANYSWSSGQTTASVAVTASATTTYSVIVSSGSCSDTAFATITVISSPSVTVSGNTTICGGSAATLVASGASNYLWNTGNTVAIITVTPSVTTTYSVVTVNGSCSSAAATTVFVSSASAANVNNATICAGQSALLTATGGGTYVWNTGSTSNPISVSPTSTSSYSVLVSIGSCSATATSTVVVYPAASVSAWSNTTINTGSSATLSATGGGSYSWSTGETTAVIIVSPAVTTVYCVISGTGPCADTSCVTVSVVFVDNCNFGDDQIFVPDAFSPNNDTKNDVLGVYFPDISCVDDLVFIVYDRWGEKVFEATSVVSTWDGSYNGKPMNTAVFVYYMKATLKSGSEVIRKGNVSLIR